MLASALARLRDPRLFLVRSLLLIAAIVVLYAVLPFDDRRWWIGALIGGAAVVAIVPITVRRVRSLRESEQPVVDAFEALAVLLALLVLGFSAVYVTIDRNNTQFAGLSTRVDAVYFTVTTLSTVGYGDIHAAGQAARFVVTLQIIFDFTFVALAIRVMSAAARDRFRSRGAAGQQRSPEDRNE